MTQPACQNHDPEIWFPSIADHTVEERDAMILTAQSICRDCPMRQACAKAALDSDATHGIWAGIWINRTGMPTARRNALLAAVRDGQPPAPAVLKYKQCIRCGWKLVSHRTRLDECPDGFRIHRKHGICHVCLLADSNPNGRPIEHTNCKECGVRLRPAKRSEDDFPGTAMHAGSGLCQAHYSARRRAAKNAA